MQKIADRYFTEGCLRCAKGQTPACKVHPWREELAALRSLLLQSGLTETCKWGVPCYTLSGKNIAVLAAFKDYCAVNFFKGSLLTSRPELLLPSGTATQVARQVRFTSMQEVQRQRSALTDLLKEAIVSEQSGKRIARKKPEDYPMPDELVLKFEEDPGFEKAFRALTPGRQNGYLLFFARAAQAVTRAARIEKYRQRIFEGKGLHDR